MIAKFNVGDIVQLKKGHPCGENRWEIMRTGADIKIRCTGCDRQVWIARMEFNRRVKKVLSSVESNEK
ncbi:hypothetical protein DUF951 [Gottschalkia acidurici 9a]|uniref:DUF951 domain-containing protein n=1 Tax=Gottschalkia acidurici (strain ATCC 7906 / DSM 604 / BCRC 14475 / CIP 104303 / KCTC 5404 / NCIMB 10678 / 9a) TaxID=1128398 RepID=K0B3Z8_GOTA9|nr:hypothetical protein DUF951 [Gottschalkia acidurici 9a]